MMDNSRVVNTYPLSSYHFYIKDQKTEKNYSVRARLSRLRLNYSIEGMKRSVEGVLLVQEHNFPYVLVFKIGDTLHKLPGGKLRPGEDEIEGLKRKLSSKFARNNPEHQQNWQIRECLGIWWRPNFDNVLYPYCDSHIQPKECTKIYLVQLSAGESLGVPENFKLLAVPLFELHDNGVSLRNMDVFYLPFHGNSRHFALTTFLPEIINSARRSCFRFEEHSVDFPE